MASWTRSRGRRVGGEWHPAPGAQLGMDRAAGRRRGGWCVAGPRPRRSEGGRSGSVTTDDRGQPARTLVAARCRPGRRAGPAARHPGPGGQARVARVLPTSSTNRAGWVSRSAGPVPASSTRTTAAANPGSPSPGGVAGGISQRSPPPARFGPADEAFIGSCPGDLPRFHVERRRGRGSRTTRTRRQPGPVRLVVRAITRAR
jgi:hypothetical protein